MPGTSTVPSLALAEREAGEHSGEEIAASVTGVLKKFLNRDGKVFSGCTDNAANMIKAFEFLKPAIRLPCLAHTLNLCLKRVLEILDVSCTQRALSLIARADHPRGEEVQPIHFVHSSLEHVADALAGVV
jgi:hypothetical protein